KTALFMWDREADSIEMLYEYKDFFRADAFAFSPDMTRAIQGQGMGASDKLYWVSRTGELQQLLSDFQRVNDPAWSPDGTTIAFFGTETYPGGDPDDFISFSQTSDLLFYPWDLYLMDADGGNVRRVLERATTPGRLQWSHTDSGRL